LSRLIVFDAQVPLVFVLSVFSIFYSEEKLNLFYLIFANPPGIFPRGGGIRFPLLAALMEWKWCLAVIKFFSNKIEASEGLLI
jgi:hypothetical protein